MSEEVRPEIEEGADPVLLDQRLFSAFAMLNALNYSEEFRDEGMHPVRLAVRSRVARLPEGTIATLADYQAKHPASWFAYTQYALMLSPPPHLCLPLAGETTWAGSMLPGLDTVLTEFWAAADLRATWQEHLPAYEADAARLRPLVVRSVDATWDYLHAPREARHCNVRVVPNLLMAYHSATVFVHPSTGTVHVIRGPCVEKAQYDLSVVHELLHTVVDSVVENSVHLIPAQGDLMALVRDLPTIRDNYGGGFLRVVVESLIRAMTRRVARDTYTTEETERDTSKEYRQGFVLIRHFVEQLAAEHEKGEQPLVSVLPDLLRGVDVMREQDRWSREGTEAYQ